MSVNERPDKPCVTVIMRNTGHNKNKRITIYETSMWPSRALPGTKWQKNRYGISGYVCISTDPWVLMQWKPWFIGVCSRRKWESQHRANLHIFLWQWREGKDQEREGKEVYLYPFSLENGDQKKYVKIQRMRGAWGTYTSTHCLCLLVKFYMWSLKSTLVLCRNIKIHLLYTYSMLGEWHKGAPQTG